MASWEQSLRSRESREEKARWFSRWEELAHRNTAVLKNARPHTEATALKNARPHMNCQMKNCKAEDIHIRLLHKKKGRAANPYDYEYAAQMSGGGDSPTLFSLPASLPRSVQASIRRDVAREEQRRKECIRQKIVARREVTMQIYCMRLLKSDF